MELLNKLISLIPNKKCTNHKDEAPCLNHVETAVFDLAVDLGFEFIRLAIWTKGENKETVSYSIDFNNFPDRWASFYDHNRFYVIDPIHRSIEKGRSDGDHTTFSSWSVAKDFSLANPLGDSPSKKIQYKNNVNQLYTAAAEHGLEAGLFFAHGDGIKQTQLSLATSDRRYLPTVFASSS